VHAVLRRTVHKNGHNAPPEASERWTFSAVVVECATRTVTRAGEAVKLTHLEFELLVHFLRNPARVFSREELLRSVWALQSGSRRTVDNFMAQLRAKLEADPDAPRHFMTVRGSGYRFDP
jgi:DNA-binding response OmpR family regulator